MTAELAKPADGYGHLISAAIEKGLGADELGKLLDLETRFHATRAERAFNVAMHAAQGDMPVVVRDAVNTFTQKAYARLENVQRAIKPVYAKNGFALNFSEGKSDRPNCIRVVCEVRHVAGHCQTYWMDGEPDVSGSKGGGNKTQVQGVGSTVSYLRRYLVLSIFNVTVADEDDDGVGTRVAPDHVKRINDELAKCEKAGIAIDYKRFLAWLGVESLDQLPLTRFEVAVNELGRRLREKQK